MSRASHRRWRRFTPILLVGVALLVYRVIAPSLPRDHDVVYELSDHAEELRKLEVAWRKPEAPDEPPTLQSTWHFAKGDAPRRLSTTVRLPTREWEVEARLELEPPAEPLEITRRVRLREGTNYVSLEGARSPWQPAPDD